MEGNLGHKTEGKVSVCKKTFSVLSLAILLVEAMVFRYSLKLQAKDRRFFLDYMRDFNAKSKDNLFHI